MSKRKILNRMLGVATLAMMFGAGAAYAQSAQDAVGQAATSNATQSGAPPDAVSGASGGSAGASKSGSGQTLSKNDQSLMREIAYANLSEIEAGKMAQTQSQNEQVKSYAQKMVDDHSKAQEELQQLAQAKGVTLPTEPDRKHQAMAKKLGALSGDKFDKQYMAQGGLADHRDTHRLLTRAQQRATDPDLKNLAAKMVPIVDQHLTQAQDLHGGKSSASGSSGTAAGRASGAAGGSSSGSSTTGTTSGSTSGSGNTAPGMSGSGEPQTTNPGSQ